MRLFSLFLFALFASAPATASAAEPLTVGLGLEHARLGVFVDDGAGDAARIETAFGAPTRTVRESEWNCTKRWRGLGLTADFVVFDDDAGNPCRTGLFNRAVVTTRRWRTPDGVGPGVSDRRAARSSPHRCTRQLCGGVTGYGFAFHRSDCSVGRFPAVIAQTSGGRVSRLIIWKRWCE
ncbi:hypothetical protein Q5424_01020 [Conexibacter sp. JD483]|uniref:hypothetical protein n=1 Tax=unclassified Conexibacter TaxID=2627773 RepID=UPI00271A2A58|nr:MULTISPECIES: hypothetical protein [unclassified Conexibacter]MDO8185809.1 hypothetical protein [Conexibacter sp. CPCC 205706]MDO8198553.1 hypothetical protein [Conexibacter sp. CPCC 205762]MDR9367639.1 hypothetical protein [Conexibacter sp. JD483]